MKIASDACAVDTAFLPSRRRASKSGNSKSTFHCSASQISSLPLMPASSWVSLRTAAATSAPSDIGAAIVITCDARKTATVGPRGLGAIDGPPLGLPRLSRKLRAGRREKGEEGERRERRASGWGHPLVDTRGGCKEWKRATLGMRHATQLERVDGRMRVHLRGSRPTLGAVVEDASLNEAERARKES